MILISRCRNLLAGRLLHDFVCCSILPVASYDRSILARGELDGRRRIFVTHPGPFCLSDPSVAQCASLPAGARAASLPRLLLYTTSVAYHVSSYLLYTMRNVRPLFTSSLLHLFCCLVCSATSPLRIDGPAVIFPVNDGDARTRSMMAVCEHVIAWWPNMTLETFGKTSGR